MDRHACCSPAVPRLRHCGQLPTSHTSLWVQGPQLCSYPLPWQPGQPRGGTSRSERGAQKPASPLLPAPVPASGLGSAPPLRIRGHAPAREQTSASPLGPTRGSHFSLRAELGKGGKYALCWGLQSPTPLHGRPDQSKLKFLSFRVRCSMHLESP